MQPTAEPRRIAILLIATLLAPIPAVAQAAEPSANPTLLIRQGKPVAVLVAPAKPSPPIQFAIDELQYHLRRATGTDLPVVTEQQAAAVPPETPRVVIGCDSLASKLGIDVAELPIDAFRIKSAGNLLVFAGHDTRTRPGSTVGGWNAATLWAVDQFLETELGVRWLWPGQIGTFVPRRSDIELPAIDYAGCPPLDMRLLRTNFEPRTVDGSPLVLSDEEYEQFVDQAYTWLRRHRMGNRTTKRFGHAFTTWWDKYGAEHPEYFAVPPAGSSDRQPWPAPKGVKLRVGSEAVDRAILAEWEAAGRPDNWNVSPNDGVGFDTSPESRALDVPPQQDPDLIWRTAESHLTARYVKFWNRLIVKMRQANPDATLSSYAYSAYRDPPPDGLKLEPGIFLECVPSYWAQDDWRRWREAGATLYLRPNWWHSGAAAPALPLHREGEFFRFAMEHGMAGFNYDSLHGYWGTRGPQYYLTARLSVRPEMSVDAVLDEYCSAFGRAAPIIREYLAYWEDFAERAAYSVAAGGEVRQPKEGAYVRLLEEADLPTHPLSGSWKVIPLMYDDVALAPACAILDRAAALTATDAPNAAGDVYGKERVAFLRAGLDHLKLVRDVLRLGYVKRRTADEQAEYVRLSTELQRRRHEWTIEHVVWGETANRYELARNAAPTFPAPPRKPEDLRGK